MKQTELMMILKNDKPGTEYKWETDGEPRSGSGALLDYYARNCPDKVVGLEVVR